MVMDVTATYPIDHELESVGKAVRILSGITAFSPLYPVRILALRHSLFSLIDQVRAESGEVDDTQTRAGFASLLAKMRALRDGMSDVMGQSRLCRVAWRAPLREWDELIEDLAFAQDDDLCGLVREIAAASKAQCG
jgi:hypothetical protein